MHFISFHFVSSHLSSFSFFPILCNFPTVFSAFQVAFRRRRTFDAARLAELAMPKQALRQRVLCCDTVDNHFLTKWLYMYTGMNWNVAKRFCHDLPLLIFVGGIRRQREWRLSEAIVERECRRRLNIARKGKLSTWLCRFVSNSASHLIKHKALQNLKRTGWKGKEADTFGCWPQSKTFHTFVLSFHWVSCVQRTFPFATKQLV